MRLLLFLLLAGIVGFPAAAEEAMSLEQMMGEREAYAERQIGERVLRDYPAAPAKEALSPDVYDYYRETLERGDCEAVLPLLFDAYIKRYPELKDSFSVSDVRNAWTSSVVREANPDYAFCGAKKGLEEELARLRERGIKSEPYEGMYSRLSVPAPFEWRNIYLSSIEMLAYRDYVPAMRLFLELEIDPKLLRMDPAQRVYLLHRLRLLGVPFPDQDAREGAAAATLPAYRVRQMVCRAEMGPAQLEEIFHKCFKDDNR